MLGKTFGNDPSRVPSRDRNRSRRPALEVLEARELLSDLPLFKSNGPMIQTDDNGSLIVFGTAEDDRIRVAKNSDRIIVRVNGRLAGSSPAAQVRSVIVYANEGDDQIEVDQAATVPVSLFGGPGYDDLQGGGEDNRLDGGAGQDTLRGRKGVRDVFELTAGQGTDNVRVSRMRPTRSS